MSAVVRERENGSRNRLKRSAVTETQDPRRRAATGDAGPGRGRAGGRLPPARRLGVQRDGRRRADPGAPAVAAARPWRRRRGRGALAGRRSAGQGRPRRGLGGARRAGRPWMACTAAAVAVLVGLGLGTWTAGSADAYGYVSQSQMWRAGALDPAGAAGVEGPLAAAGVVAVAARVTGRPPRQASIVPTYPPGLPLAMAAASSVAGFRAVFWIVPLLGGVGRVDDLPRRAASSLTRFSASVGALLLAVSPVFLYQVVQPMSDVPVTAWWMGALAGMLSGHPLVVRPVRCRGAADAAEPRRAGRLAARRARWRERAAGRTWRAVSPRSLLYGAPVAAAAGSLAVLNAHLYGHPLASGYGPAGALFSTANVSTNLRHFISWLWSTQTPFVFAGLLAPARGCVAACSPSAFAALVLGQLPCLRAVRGVVVPAVPAAGAADPAGAGRRRRAAAS